jgi:hypothetical protein
MGIRVAKGRGDSKISSLSVRGSPPDYNSGVRSSMISDSPKMDTWKTPPTSVAGNGTWPEFDGDRPVIAQLGRTKLPAIMFDEVRNLGELETTTSAE